MSGSLIGEDFNLLDRVIVVTGASRGLGYAFAQKFAAHGASLGLLARDRSSLAELAQRLPTEALPIECDVRDANQVNEAFDAVFERFGSIDAVVANAGALIATDLAADLSIKIWNDVLSVNLTGAFITAQSAYKYLRSSSSGRLVFISSAAVKEPTKGMPAYVAAKAGVEGLVRALCVEWARDGIRVNAVAPGLMDNDAVRELSDQAKASVMSKTVLRYQGNVSDLANMVLLLVGDSCEFVTGQIIAVDGGYGLT